MANQKHGASSQRHIHVDICPQATGASAELFCSEYEMFASGFQQDDPIIMIQKLQEFMLSYGKKKAVRIYSKTK